MLEIVEFLEKNFQECNRVSFLALNPDFYSHFSTGERTPDGIYRSYKLWSDLAELFFSKILTPVMVCEKYVEITFQKLNVANSFHHEKDLKEEKYGVKSSFYSIEKAEDASFLYHYKQALCFVDLKRRKRVLNLGVNRGDEFATIKKILKEEYGKKEFVGVDFCPSAIAAARESFQESNTTFLQEDINNIKDLNLKRFDLILSIGTLQSPKIDFKKTFMYLYQELLEKDGGIILGFPNCRWIDGEAIYGAKAPNYSFSEMTLLLKDLHFCKKYLQQKKYRVTLTGKNYIFLTATKIGQKS